MAIKAWFMELFIGARIWLLNFYIFHTALCGIVGDCSGNGFEVQSFGKYVYLF